MRIYPVFLLIISFTFCTLEAQAQLLRKLKNAAEAGVSRAVEKTVEKQVQKATERQLEKAFENLYGDTDSTRTGGTDGAKYDFSKIMGSINMNVETEDEYNFSGVAIMEIISIDAKGKSSDPVRFNSLLSQEADYYGIEFTDEKQSENEKSVIIFDQKNNATVMLMENEEERSSMAFDLDWDGMMEGMNVAKEEKQDEAEIEDFKFEKSGKTKDILGYTCDEYVVVSDEVEGNYWVSQSEIDGFSSFWGKNNPFVSKKLKNENTSYFEQLPEGNILEMDFLSKEDQSRTQMKMIEIDQNNSSSFDMGSYPNPMKGTE